jgi:hypothetical protein
MTAPVHMHREDAPVRNSGSSESSDTPDTDAAENRREFSRSVPMRKGLFRSEVPFSGPAPISRSKSNEKEKEFLGWEESPRNFR